MKVIYTGCQSPQKTHTLAITFISNRIIHMRKEDLCKACTTELLRYSKSKQTAVTKLIFRVTIYNLVPIPLGLLIQLSTDLRRNFCLKEVQSLGLVSERLKCIANRYSIRTDFKMRHNLTNSLMRTRPIRIFPGTANCVDLYFL
jgi:hypothetical protein